MALDNAKNFAKVTVSTTYDASATSIVLESGHGTKLPTAPFNVVWWNSTDYPDPSDDPNVEIVRVTNVATDTLTVTRAQEGTSATTKNTGAEYKMIAGLFAAAANDLVTTQDLNNPRVVVLVGPSYDLPSEPDLVDNDVAILHQGVGILGRVASAPANGEFSLGGAGNVTPTFGFDPETGDVLYAIYVEA